MTMTTLCIVVLFPSLLGWLAATYLRRPLLQMLEHECGTEDRADFWVRVTTLGMMAGPTALALMRSAWWRVDEAPAEIARMLLSVSLNGMLMVLVGLAFAIWLRIPRGERAKGGAS